MATRAFSRFQTAFGGKKSDSIATGTDAGNTSPAPETIQDEEKKDTKVDGIATVNDDGSESDPDHPSHNAQHGVQKVEAVTLAWSKKALIFVFVKYVAMRLCAIFSPSRAC